jgi:hypothetical protein
MVGTGVGIGVGVARKVAWTSRIFSGSRYAIGMAL